MPDEEWKFVEPKCPECGEALEEPGEVELTAKPLPGEEPFPERYMAPCPSCGAYNFVVKVA